jgi:uncharacterized lipoprotein YddW (UPF0748 family)
MVSFSDTQSHWARSFISGLAARQVVRGFEDGTFRPNQPVSRAEFAAILRTAFAQPMKRLFVPFVDVPANHWAVAAIREAYETGFLSGFPDRRFRPNDTLTRLQAWVSLVSGLGLVASGQVSLSKLYQDSVQIPAWALTAIAAATEAELVVNYPNLQRLRSLEVATRADVAAFVYQALVRLNQLPDIASNAIVRWRQPVAVSHRREFRAVWVTSVWNTDWTSKPGLSVAAQQAELIAILDRVQAINLNAVILQVRSEADAGYDSALEPWSHWLTGTQGKPPEPFYDPLAFAIAQCHQRNLELHAWFNPYRARTTRQVVNAKSHIAIADPEAVCEWGNQLWLNPGIKRVQDHTYNVILDVVRRYDIDAVHLDDYFYPYPIANQDFPDQPAYQSYRNMGGRLSLADWRRENVNQMVQRLATGIHAAKPWVKFGISPFGIYRPGQPPQIQGLDAYDRLYADSLKWLQQGWVDYLAPQLYWSIDPPAQSYPVLQQWWTENNPQQRHLYIGNNLTRMDGIKRDLTEIERQIALTRQASSRLALGNIFFSMEAFLTNRLGICDSFQTETYRTPALAPTMPWLKLSAPEMPVNLQVQNRNLTWSAAASVRSWTLYQQNKPNWILKKILPATTTTIDLEPGTYALCAVDRLANESQGVVAIVR